MSELAIRETRRSQYRYWDGRGPWFPYMTMDEWADYQAKRESARAERERPKPPNKGDETLALLLNILAAVGIVLPFALFVITRGTP